VLITNRNRDFWQEVRKIHTRKLSHSYLIGGLSNANEIVQLFVDKYRHIFTNISYEQTEMKKINDRIDNQLTEDGFSSDCFVTADVKNAVSRLKRDKRDVNNYVF
jgi:hypothetical protein